MKPRRLPVVLIAFAVAVWLGAILEVRAALASDLIDADEVEFELGRGANQEVSVAGAEISSSK